MVQKLFNSCTDRLANETLPGPTGKSPTHRALQKDAEQPSLGRLQMCSSTPQGTWHSSKQEGKLSGPPHLSSCCLLLLLNVNQVSAVSPQLDHTVLEGQVMIPSLFEPGPPSASSSHTCTHTTCKVNNKHQRRRIVS